MILSDNISCAFQIPKPLTLNTLKEPADPTFLYDVKLHLRKRPDHWKEVQAFRFENKIHFTRDAEIEYCKHKIELLNNDISLFLLKHPDASSHEFCTAFRGYALTYGEELIRRAILRLA